jgi:class 3 adenylate cyclase/GAF domain-containing protein
MDVKKWLGELSLENKNLYYKLTIIFSLFFIVPTVGFLYFGFKYNILKDSHIPFYFIGFLAFSFFGYSILRNIFDQIRNLSERVTTNFITELDVEPVQESTNELQNIIASFSSIENKFNSTLEMLEQKASEVSILKELSELCYVTFDTEEILNVTLERSMTLTKSDLGSILTLDTVDKKAFVVKATKGLGEYIKVGDRIDFEESIAKHAVINKSPLIVEDIEKDNRFGRSNLAHYGTKSFVCMPIKTSKEIIGVMTLSRKNVDLKYSHQDVEALTPLLSNAAFTYDNLRLIKSNKQVAGYLGSIEKIFKIINSSFRDSELLHAVLNEIQSVIPYKLAIVMTLDDKRPGYINIFDFLTTGTVQFNKGAHYPYKNSVIERVLKQESLLIIEDTSGLIRDLDKNLFQVKGCQACMLVPLRVDGIVKGFLSLSAQNSDHFHAARELILWIANGLSLAIERNRLSASVAQRAQEMDSIRQIGSALASSTFDMRKVLKYTMAMIRVLMNVEAGSLMVLSKKELKIAVAFNIRIKSMRKVELKLGQGIAGYVAAKGESIIVNEARKSPHFYPGVDKETGFKTRSVLCVPMISQGKVIGVIEVLNKIMGEFSERDEDLLQSIASSVSIAIENARLYKETVSMAQHERSIRRMFQKFVPKEVLDKIIHGEETDKVLIEELKTITLLNVDIRGFSGLARKIGPTKTVSMLNRFFSIMGTIVFKHHGIVDKYLGDGFLALFGAPVSSTRDADNAITAALEMKNSIPELNRKYFRELGSQLYIGISIHTGEVVVGNIGFEKKMDYTVIGDSVNLVFRLQELTKSIPNGILIGENTLWASRSDLEYREIEQTLGGFKLYELLDQKRVAEEED